MPTKFEYQKHNRTIKEYKLLVEIINQIQITRWSKDILFVQHDNPSHTYWELMTACVARVFMNEYYENMKAK